VIPIVLSSLSPSWPAFACGPSEPGSPGSEGGTKAREARRNGRDERIPVLSHGPAPGSQPLVLIGRPNAEFNL